MTDRHGTPFTRLQLESLRSGVEESLHLLPCQVHRQGAAKVEEFFSPAIRAAHGGKEVSFRGRKLRGQEVTLPAGYMGIVLKEDHKPCAEEEDRCLNVRSIYQSFTQWNLETPPSADDVLVMSLAWPKIASAIHAPVQ